MTITQKDLTKAWQQGFDAGWDRFAALLVGGADPKPPANPHATCPHEWGLYWHHESCGRCGATRRTCGTDCRKCDEAEQEADEP